MAPSEWELHDLNSPPGYVLLCLKTETVPASEPSSFSKKLDDGQSPKKENCVSLCHDLLSHLSTRDNLVMQMLVWLRTVQFTSVWFSASYTNSRPHTFKHQI